MTFPILASLLVRLVVLLPFQLLRLSLATPSRWTPLALSVFLHCVVDRKSGSAGMPRPISYAVFCLKKETLIYDSKGLVLVSRLVISSVRVLSARQSLD